MQRVGAIPVVPKRVILSLLVVCIYVELWGVCCLLLGILIIDILFTKVSVNSMGNVLKVFIFMYGLLVWYVALGNVVELRSLPRSGYYFIMNKLDTNMES